MVTADASRRADYRNEKRTNKRSGTAWVRNGRHEQVLTGYGSRDVCGSLRHWSQSFVVPIAAVFPFGSVDFKANYPTLTTESPIVQTRVKPLGLSPRLGGGRTQIYVRTQSLRWAWLNIMSC